MKNKKRFATNAILIGIVALLSVGCANSPYQMRLPWVAREPAITEDQYAEQTASEYRAAVVSTPPADTTAAQAASYPTPVPRNYSGGNPSSGGSCSSGCCN